MRCPYNYTQLRIAASTASIKMKNFETTHGEAVAIGDRIAAESDISDTASLNRKVAAEHGMSVDSLISNPNYEVLKMEYLAEHIERTVTLMQEAFNLTHQEAWALMVADELGIK